ncbi:hypothetical protein L9F63_023872, partial [Diploptera punctata]
TTMSRLKETHHHARDHLKLAQFRGNCKGLGLGLRWTLLAYKNPTVEKHLENRLDGEQYSSYFCPKIGGQKLLLHLIHCLIPCFTKFKAKFDACSLFLSFYQHTA